MNYEIIQPPFTLKFKEMPKKELREYFEWFQKVVPRRIDELANAVGQTHGGGGWQPDLSPESLNFLGEWFASHVETRTRTSDEIQEIGARSIYPIEVSGEELTNRAFSLSVDVAIYLSQVFLKAHPSIRLEQLFGSKSFVDYGQPVLTGFGAAPFNPVRMVVTLAYGIASKNESGDGLAELYKIWRQFIRP